MANTMQSERGAVVSLWRYPVKSMIGEELNASEVTERGLLGDRAYALVDPSDGKVASAKHPRKWAKFFDCHAAFADLPCPDQKMPPVRITLPDGTLVSSAQSDLNQVLSQAFGREVTLATTAPQARSFEVYWPDMQRPVYTETVTDVPMPVDRFHDAGVIHLLTTAAIDQLRELYPQGRFEVRRFRPNIVVETPAGEKGFVEDAWVGSTLAIGDEVRLSITRPCPRCMMITLPQGDLPRDPGILRTTAQHNQFNVGVYAAVLQGGTIRRGDPVRFA